MRQTVANALADGAFDQLDDDRRRQLAQEIRHLIEAEHPDILDLTPGQMADAADRVAKEAVDRLGLPARQEPLAQRVWSFPLGFLATDHVGYASFDLRRLESPPELGNVADSKVRLFVYPMGTEGERLEALSQQRTTAEAVFAKFEIDASAQTPDIRILNLPAMQNPSLTDWYLSPGSFTTQPDFLVGAEGCEALVPSQLSLEEFLIAQVVRLRDVPAGLTIPQGARAGYLDAYRVSWYALGHSLGEIKYRLPLAPGESVRLALIDWSWRGAMDRSEDTTVKESLLHTTHRERAITETMNASLQGRRRDRRRRARERWARNDGGRRLPGDRRRRRPGRRQTGPYRARDPAKRRRSQRPGRGHPPPVAPGPGQRPGGRPLPERRQPNTDRRGCG